jgi:hypothetical protein
MPDQITPELFATFAIHQNLKISIVIPVRDEAENIEKTLNSLLNQIDLDGSACDFKSFEILILINNSTDDSAKIIENFQRENPQLNLHSVETVLPAENANIGFVRRILMNAAFDRLRKSKSGNGVIMTTDGDTFVAKDWIAANLSEIENGADAVGGRIIISHDELEKMDASCRETHLKDEEYRLLLAEIEDLIDYLPFDPAPRHHQHFNGSFAVTTEMYEKAGGIPDVKFLEDCAFFDALQRIDARVRHSPNVCVFTSSRREGRSEVGLSFQLNEWKNLCESGADFFVESAASIVERISLRKALRDLWTEFLNSGIADLDIIKSISARFSIAPEFVQRELEKNSLFGAFYEKLMIEQNRRGEWTKKFPPVPLDEALRELKKKTEKRRLQSFSQTSTR